MLEYTLLCTTNGEQPIVTTDVKRARDWLTGYDNPSCVHYVSVCRIVRESVIVTNKVLEILDE